VDGDGGGLAGIATAIQQCLLRHEGNISIQEHGESVLEALM
jgi:hypothetical protein